MPDGERTRIAAALLNVVRLMGYHVTVHRRNGITEIEAVAVNDPNDRHLVRRPEGDSADDEYVAACQLAGMLHVDWEEF
jgi:hypothetical protein